MTINLMLLFKNNDEILRRNESIIKKHLQDIRFETNTFTIMPIVPEFLKNEINKTEQEILLKEMSLTERITAVRTLIKKYGG